MYLTLFTGVMLTSCTDEDHTGASGINYSSVAITLTSAQATYTINESLIDIDVPSTYTITITASIPETQQVDAYVTFEQTEGKADGNDYSVGELKIPAGATTASTKIEIHKTGDIEGIETFNLSAKTNGNFTLASSFNLPVTIIDDHINDVLEFSITWSGSYTFESFFGEVTADFCLIDLDVLLFNSAGSFVQYLGATGACTETGSISGLPDGEYYLVIEVYDNPFYITGESEPVPVTISYNQEYFASESFVSNSFDMGTTGLVAVATITISDGYNYTVTPL